MKARWAPARRAFTTPPSRDATPDYDETTPCSTHSACQPVGSTWTFIRRRQYGQNRGGSSTLARAHATWSSASGPPQRSHHSGSTAALTGTLTAWR